MVVVFIVRKAFHAWTEHTFLSENHQIGSWNTMERLMKSKAVKNLTERCFSQKSQTIFKMSGTMVRRHCYTINAENIKSLVRCIKSMKFL